MGFRALLVIVYRSPPIPVFEVHFQSLWVINLLQPKKKLSRWTKKAAPCCTNNGEKLMCRLLVKRELRRLSHHCRNVFGFSGSPSHATSTGRSYGSQITRNWFWGNPRPNYFQDRGPRDPKWVPWDQKNCLKNFLMPSPYDAILCVFVVCFTKNWENQQKQANFAVLLLNGQKYQKWLVFDYFFHFL